MKGKTFNVKNNCVWKATLLILKIIVYESLTSRIKNDWVWRPTLNELKIFVLNELKIIVYERQHFKYWKWLSMKTNISWTNNSCAWKPTL